MKKERATEGRATRTDEIEEVGPGNLFLSLQITPKRARRKVRGSASRLKGKEDVMRCEGRSEGGERAECFCFVFEAL